MVLLCFVLDLCNLSPPLLRDLKQCLFQLANFYAISPPSRHRSESITDKIGLCYLFKNRSSYSVEVKFAYTPRGNFSLRDFHHAVNNSFFPILLEIHGHRIVHGFKIQRLALEHGFCK